MDARLLSPQCLKCNRPCIEFGDGMPHDAAVYHLGDEVRVDREIGWVIFNEDHSVTFCICPEPEMSPMPTPRPHSENL